MRLGPPSSTALTAVALTLLAGAAAPASATTATTPAAAPTASAVRVADPAPAATHCVPAAPLRLQGSQRPAGPAVGLCVTVSGASMTVSASADCACTTSGTWTARRGDAQDATASGTLGARAEYAGPGTYAVTATVSIGGGPREAASTTPLTGTVGGTFALAAVLPAPTHRVEVAPATLRPGTTTTLTYKITQVAAEGDGSARLGVIGEPGSGVSVTSPDARCVNPLTSGSPTRRSPHAVDCTLTDLAAGRPAAVTVRVTLPSGSCSSVVSKLGYWTPKGQQVSGAMLNGPMLSCR
ncbi:hypothetical protein ACF053_14970 [Streptomyces kanasensis]|uniref:hypothetical protein n=1 Tax=Streptomyces kanasensis TaxID=936756 RepID=UPI0036FBC23A